MDNALLEKEANPQWREPAETLQPRRRRPYEQHRPRKPGEPARLPVGDKKAGRWLDLQRGVAGIRATPTPERKARLGSCSARSRRGIDARYDRHVPKLWRYTEDPCYEKLTVALRQRIRVLSNCGMTPARLAYDFGLTEEDIHRVLSRSSRQGAEGSFPRSTR